MDLFAALWEEIGRFLAHDQDAEETAETVPAEERGDSAMGAPLLDAAIVEWTLANEK